MQKTLGGDRLGSGKKMKVELHNYERSTHDQGYIWRSTMSAGTLVPFMVEIGLPGTTFDINLDCDVKTHPTIGPLFGSYKVQLDVFLCPIRLYNSYLHNNMLGIGREMSTIKLPQIELTSKVGNVEIVADVDNCQINPSCLLSYLGIRGVGILGATDVEATRQFNAVAILAYWEIYKNYYANKQEEIGAVIHTPAVALVQTIDQIDAGDAGSPDTVAQAPATSNVPITQGSQIIFAYTGADPIPSQVIIAISPGGQARADELFENFQVTGVGEMKGDFKYSQWGDISLIRWRYAEATDPAQGPPKVATFDLSNLDDMRKDILSTDGNVTYLINDLGLPPYSWLVEAPNDIPNILSSQEGLACKTYQSDLFNNWLKTENIQAISDATAVSTAGNEFTIDALIISKKVWQMLNRINVSGGSYDDWMDAVYVHDRYKTMETPMYMGGLIKELVFQEVVSNSQSGDQPLGQLAGRGILSKKHKGGNIVVHVDEPAYLIGLASLTPRVDYSQGNKWDVNLKTMDDFHKPAMDGIGFQDLITEQMAWWNTWWNDTTWVQHSAGKQPAWMNYMTNVNKTYGNFAIAENEMFMTLNRRYEWDNAAPDIKDLTTYIDPSKFNFIFAETALDAQNFWTQIAVDITARRKMSAKIMPNI